MTWVIVAVLVLATVGFVAQGFGAIRAQRDIEAAVKWPRVPTDPGLPQMRDRRPAAQVKRARRAARNLRNAQRQRAGRPS
jgi:hypothetical protein